MSTHPPKSSSRREFLKNSTAATLAGTTAVGLASGGLASGGLATGGLATGIAGAFPRPAQDGVLRVGLVGCGGRGGSAATNALRADPNVQLVALGDTFEDRALATREQLRKVEDVSLRVQVDDDHVFTGFDAYKQVTDAVDVVLLATAPHFRPLHVAYAVEQGKHLFVEKPVATDAVGVRSIKESCQKAAERNLTVVSGLCYRYQFAKKETVKRIQEGAVGDIRALRTTYNTGELWHRGRRDEWSEMEYQIRNWLYFTWLSGDHIAEQHIHSLDKLAWVMDGYPVKATSSGGRIKRTDPKFGNIYDHFNTVFEWENGVVGFSSCRQWSGCSSDVSDYVYGTKGVANIQRHTIETDGERWRYRGEGPDDMYQNEHDAMFKAIRAGEPINNGEYMCNSTMMAIMARMAAYTGQTITWEQAWNSALDLSPEAYAWGDAPQRPVAIPGLTKFV